MKTEMTGKKYKVTFWDYSDRFRLGWCLRALFRSDVYMYWDLKQKAWCRMVTDVECLAVDGWYIPLSGQLVDYPQKMP